MLTRAERLEIAALIVALSGGCSAPPKADDCRPWGDVESATPQERAGDPNGNPAAKTRFWAGLRCPFT